MVWVAWACESTALVKILAPLCQLLLYLLHIHFSLCCQTVTTSINYNQSLDKFHHGRSVGPSETEGKAWARAQNHIQIMLICTYWTLQIYQASWVTIKINCVLLQVYQVSLPPSFLAPSLLCFLSFSFPSLFFPSLPFPSLLFFVFLF